MLPSGEAVTGDLAQTGVTGADVLAVVDSSLSGSAVAASIRSLPAASAGLSRYRSAPDVTAAFASATGPTALAEGELRCRPYGLCDNRWTGVAGWNRLPHCQNHLFLRQ